MGNRRLFRLDIVIVAWSCIFLLADVGLCQDAAITNNTGSATSVSDNNTSHEAASDTGESVNVLVVRTIPSGDPCLLAALNATIQISYKVLEGIVHERYVTTEDIQLPEDVTARGVCSNDTSMLILAWGNGTFHVNLTFTLEDPATETENSTWSLTNIAVAYDLSNTDVFPGASEANVVVAEKTEMSLFVTELGHTFSCQRDIVVLVGTDDQGATLKFHNVLLAAFGVTSSEFPNEVDTCLYEDTVEEDEELVVSLIVACCLAAVVIFIVIGYVIKRQMEQDEAHEYKTM